MRVININHLNECIVFDIKLGDKIFSFVVFYRSPSQTDELESFFKKFRTLDRVMQNTPYMMVVSVTLMLNPLTGINMIKQTLKE